MDNSTPKSVNNSASSASSSLYSELSNILAIGYLRLVVQSRRKCKDTDRITNTQPKKKINSLDSSGHGSDE